MKGDCFLTALTFTNTSSCCSPVRDGGIWNTGLYLTLEAAIQSQKYFRWNCDLLHCYMDIVNLESDENTNSGNYSWNFVDAVSWKSLLVAFLKNPLQCIHADPPFLSYTIIIIQNFLWFIYLYDLKFHYNINTITARSQFHDRMASISVYVFKSSSTWVKANEKFCVSTHSYKNVYIWSLASKDKTICKMLRTGNLLAWVNLYVLI